MDLDRTDHASMLVYAWFFGCLLFVYTPGGLVVTFGCQPVAANDKGRRIAGIGPLLARRIKDMAAKRIREDVYVRPTAFTVAPEHIEKLETLKAQLGLSRSEIVRQLIEAATPEKLEQPAA